MNLHFSCNYNLFQAIPSVVPLLRYFIAMSPQHYASIPTQVIHITPWSDSPLVHCHVNAIIPIINITFMNKHPSIEPLSPCSFRISFGISRAPERFDCWHISRERIAKLPPAFCPA